MGNVTNLGKKVVFFPKEILTGGFSLSADLFPTAGKEGIYCQN